LRISIVGAGYVGLTSAVCYADRGFNVYLLESDRAKAQQIKVEEPPFYEAGLREMLHEALASGKLEVSSDVKKAVLGSEITFIAVGTPSLSDGSIDLTHVGSAAKDIGKTLKIKGDYHLVVVRSTVTPGTTLNFVKPSLESSSGKRVGVEVGLAMQPEFLKEGSAIQDTFNPSRVVIGEYDSKSGDTLESFCRKLHGENVPPILRMNPTSAEVVKYASNAFLATKVSFINQIANICEKVEGVDVVKVADAMGLDDRIGRKFLNAGPGFGGSCFPKDLKALVAFSRELGYEPKLLEATLRINEEQANHVAELVREELGSVKEKKIAVLGLAFKPDTDDMRESQSIRIINRLMEEGAEVQAYDPAAMKNARELFGEKILYADSATNCLSGADCAVIVTEWDEFKKLNVEDFKRKMRTPIVVDTRRIYNPQEFRSLRYRAVGLKESAYTDEDERKVKERLRSLGYLG